MICLIFIPIGSNQKTFGSKQSKKMISLQFEFSFLFLPHPPTNTDTNLKPVKINLNFYTT